MADEDPEERRHPPAFKQQLTKDMMNATGMLQEQAKSFLKTYDWNLEAALHGYLQRLLEPGARARGLPPALALAAREAEAAARARGEARAVLEASLALPAGAAPPAVARAAARADGARACAAGAGTGACAAAPGNASVSYTHLTLPTILLV